MMNNVVSKTETSAEPSMKSSRKSSAKKLKPGISEISLMLVFQVLQSIRPKLASLMAYHFWFHPGRKSIRKIPAYTPEGYQAFQFKLNGKTIRYWSAGSGPLVLLVHGWATCGNQMAKPAQSLIDSGYRVIWFDAPAHGQSTGWQTSLFEVSQAISDIQQREGEFEAVLAHSFGVPCSLYAMHNGLKTKKLIAIASPATAVGLIEKFCKILKANKQTHRYLSQRIDQFLGDMTISEIAAENMAQGIDQSCLVIHDKHDRMVRISEGRAVQKNLKHSTFMQTERLGHNRILNDPQVISSCVDFIQA